MKLQSKDTFYNLMMIKYLSFVIGALVVANFNSCQRVYSQETVNNYQNIRWLHAHEEDSNDYQIYRPQEYSFAASRGRTGFELNSGGQGYFGRVAPTDGVIWVAAAWLIKEENILEILVAGHKQAQKSLYRYRIENLQKDKLTLVFLGEKQDGGR